MNVFTATCRLGNDPEQRYTQNGDSVVSFNGAVDSGFGDKKTTTWIKFSLFGKRGESLLPYLKKGNPCVVSGELTNRKWMDKENNERYSLEVRLNEVTLIGGNSSNTHAQKDANSANSQKQKPSFDDIGDDIPF